MTKVHSAHGSRHHSKQEARTMKSLGTKGMARLAKEARFYGGGKGGYKGAPDAQYGSAGKGDYGFGGKGGGKGDMGYGAPPGMDMYGGKGGKGDMYGAPPGMDMYGGKGGGKGDMYGGKGGGKGDMGYGAPPGMDMYGGKGGGKGDMYGAPPGMDMYGGKGGKGDMYGGKGGKGDMGYGAPPGMDMYGGKGGGKGDMYGGKGGKGNMGGPPQGMSVGVPPATARIPASSLKLDFPYPAGQVPEMGMFDVRDEVCKSMGFLHGQKLRVTNPQNPSEMFEMVVVGAARDPEVGDVAMWFHIAGEPGAGMFHVEMLDAYREFMQVVGKVQLNPLTAEEQKQLAEHGKLVRRMQLNEMNIECFHSWRMAKTLKKMWQPAKIDGAPFPPQCDFGYPMSTGVKPEESKEKGEPVNCYATFDKRQEVLNLFEIDGVKLSHGVTIVVPEKGKETREWVVIGSRPMPGVRYVLWAHPAGDPGARPISLRKLKKATLKNAPPTAIVEDKKENYEHAEDDIDVSQLLAFERFVARAERAVVRKVKKNKGKKGDSKKEAKKEEAKEEEPKKQ